MAKAVKKSAPKAQNKGSGKASAKDAVKSAVKAIAKTLSKTAGKAKPSPKKEAKAPASAGKNDKKKAVAPKAKPAKTESVKPKSDAVAKVAAKKSPAKSDAKASKKKPRKNEDEDEFLPEAIDGGEEELPDLEEFDENEEEEVVEEADVDSDDDDEEEVIEARPADDEIVLTDAEGRRYCKVKDCDQIGVVDGYCRYHYLLLWKKIQVRRKILADGKLERYVEELTSRYPDKFLEMIRRDLKSEKDFLSAIAELEIDESALDNEYEDEAQSYIDEVRGVSETGGMSEDEEF